MKGMLVSFLVGNGEVVISPYLLESKLSSMTFIPINQNSVEYLSLCKCNDVTWNDEQPLINEFLIELSVVY